MSTTKWIAISVLAGVGVVAVLSWNAQRAPQAEGQPASGQQGVITAQLPAGPADGAPASAPRAPYAASAPQLIESPLDSVTPPACRTSSSGDLIVDPQTRDDVELVVSLYKTDKALAKLTEACKEASPQALREMKNLYQQFVQYSQAVTQTFPIEEQNEIPVDKLEAVLLKGLHDLRVQYFGAEKACAMYCEEEELTRRMLAIANDYKLRNPKASTEEAVGYAQGEISKQLAAQQGDTPEAGQEGSKPAGR